jgi:putative copper resistance protein D
MGRIPFDAHHALTQWEFTPFALLVLLAVVTTGAWYVRAQWMLPTPGGRWSRKRTLSFIAGLVVIDVALQSPVAAFTMSYFQAHVVQHLLLMVIAPPLLAMGAPVTLALQTSSPTAATRLLRIINSRPFQNLTHPVLVWFFYYFSMFAFFLTFVLNFAMLHMWAMDVINIGFLVASMLFWWLIVGVDPIPHWQMSHGARMTNLLIGIPVESFLALALMNNGRPAASMYSLAGTHSGAVILWFCAELCTMVALIPVLMQWLRLDERKGARYAPQLDVELSA